MTNEKSTYTKLKNKKTLYKHLLNLPNKKVPVVPPKK